MKRSTNYRITFAAILATTLVAASELSAIATSRLTHVRQASPIGQETLVAGRLGFRLRVRPSRFRIGGFSRGSCPPVTITPVAPPTRPEEITPGNDGAVDSTTSAHPTVFVNIPAELAAKTAELTLQDEAGDQELYKTTFTLTDKPGIVGIRIPNTVPSLEVGQKYLWQMKVACDPNNAESNLYTGSWIERVPLDSALASQIEQATPQEKLALYAEAGVWQEALSTLAELRYRNPNDQSLAQDWASLMESVNLKDFASKAVVQIAGN